MKKLITVWILSFLVSFCYAQTNTVSLKTGTKNFTSGYAGDGMIDTMALYDRITSIAADSSGNLYIYDQNNYRIRKIHSSTHIVTTIAGNGAPGFSGDGGPAVLAQVGAAPPNTAVGGRMTCSPGGDIYFFDYGNNRIRKVDASTGTITTIAGGGTSMSDSVDALTADIFASAIQYFNGYIYFSDHYSIRKLDPATHLLTYVHTSIDDISTMTVDNWGNIYFAVNNESVVKKIDPTGTISIVAGSLYQHGASGDGGPATNAKLSYPSSITTDPEGNVYIGNGFVVRKVSASNGYIHTVLGNGKPDIYLAYTGSASSGTSIFASYLSPLPADTYEDDGFNVYFSAALGKLFAASSKKIIAYNPPAYTVHTFSVRDTLLSSPCTLPGVHAYAFSGNLAGTPPTGDSINVIFDYYDGTSYTMRLPLVPYIDGSGTTVYGFGNSSAYTGTHSFTMPGLYPVCISFSADNHFTNIYPALDTVGSSCNFAGVNHLWIYSTSDSITTAPCVPSATVRFHIEGNAFTFNSDFSYGPLFLTPFDSVYVTFDFQDGTTELQKVPFYDYSEGLYNATTYHNYPIGMTDVAPVVSARLNNGLDINTQIMHSFSIPDCSIPGTASSSVVIPDSAYTLCSTPFNAAFAVGSTLTGSSIAYDSLSYYVNFGDGSDTTITIMRSSDGWGNYFMSDTIHHTYYMPGAYTTAITPSDGSGTMIDSTLTVGSSCSHLSGVYYRDGNANCTADADERRLSFWPMAVVNNTLNDTSFAWCDTFGHYALSLINGNSYTIIPNYFGYFGYGSDSFVLSCPASGFFNITPTPGSTYTQDFAFTCAGSPASVDMNLAGFAWGIIPGDTGVVGIWSSNDWGYMCDSLNSTVTLTLDPLLTYVGMWDGPAPTSVSGGTLTWNFHTQANLLDFHADVKVRCATTATMGSSVCNTLHVTPTSFPDPDTANNTYNWCEPVRSSWDPNEKEVSPKGFGPEGYILNGTPLTYTVHFQNTGTARARNITINDTISEHLDIATLQVVSSSAPVLVYQPELTGNLIKFRFNDINLPDSGTDFNGSNGYVVFNIYPKAGLAPGTQINNTVGIYFDYNPAVVTNTTTNTIEYELGAISGGTEVCVAGTLALSNSIAGGVWSAANAHATVSAAGLVTGVSAGVDTIYYTAYGGDQKVFKVIAINPLPVVSTTTGTPSVCPAATTTLSNSTTGGTWASSNANATVAGGVVTGVTTGSSIISYSVTNTCGTAVDTMLVTIEPLPVVSITTGAASVCAGSTTTLSNTTGGGTWSSSTASHATVAGGIVTGVAAGTAVISYAVSNACGTVADTMLFTVNPLPDAGTITGTNHVCVGGSVTLTNAATGGTWLASTGTADVTDGVVTGLSAGNVVIFYTVTNTCGTAEDTMAIVVNAVPDAGTITGTTTICNGTSSTLAASMSGGTWSSSNAATASVDATGVVNAISVGSATISYVLSNECGADTATTSINVVNLPDPGTISGADTVCPGATISLYASVGSGTWSTSDNTLASVSSSGVVTGVGAGSVTISYQVSNVCGPNTATYSVTVLPLTACPDNVSTMPGNTSLTLYPNPNDGTFSIVGTWPGSDRVVTVEIVNVLGQTAYKNTATVTNGELKVLLQTTNLATGSYLVRLSDGGQMQTLRCTISK
jgi:hypothetical protein